MGSTDLFSSARGPGVVGMLLALVVLIGFGTLFMLAFDEGAAGGGKSLVAQIRDADKRIASETARIESGEKTLATIPQLKEISTKLVAEKSKKDFLDTRIEQRKSEIAELQTTIESLHEEIADYKNQYRAFVRNDAVGMKIEELKTLSGEIYTDVDVRKITAVGIEIRHKNGHKRISFENLPEEMQDYYQFDKNQMIAEMQREAKIRKKHNTAVAVAEKAAQKRAAEQRLKNQEKARQDSIRELAMKESQLGMVSQEIQQLQSELISAENAAQAARASGRVHVSKSNGINNRLSRKRSEYSRLQAEIASLRSSL